MIETEHLRVYIEESPERFERMLLPAYLYNAALCPVIEGALGTDSSGKPLEDFSKPGHEALFHAIKEYHALTNYGHFASPSLSVLYDTMIKMCRKEAGRFALTESMVPQVIEDFGSMCSNYVAAYDQANDTVKRGMFYWLEDRRLQLLLRKRQTAGWSVQKFSDEWSRESVHVKNLSGAAGSVKRWHSITDCFHEPPVDVFLTFPWQALNERIGGGLARGDATLIISASGGGKTIMAAQTAAYMALYLQAKGIFISTEQKGTHVFPRMAACYAGIPFNDMDRTVQWDRLTEQQKPRVLNLHDRLKAAEFYFCDWMPGDNITTGLANIVRHYKERISSDGRLDFIVFDWLGGKVVANFDDEADKRNKMQLAADTVAYLADEHDICTIATAQASGAQGIGRPAVGAAHLKDNKTMHINFENCFGLSTLVEGAPDLTSTEVQARYAQLQFINIDKARFGSGGLVPVHRNYGYQRLDVAAAK